ncbi:exported hypothetical protein [uncultured Eubacteriales bacterium]|uniref:Uncharacterized protein n=1 Tax=uncultured Eubacteriales bacterium TaxID=172733 RepID=A0A212J7D0_9FIRM|nr:exported hypothetical protein [uncultured Eubacteriales bacterium]
MAKRVILGLGASTLLFVFVVANFTDRPSPYDKVYLPPEAVVTTDGNTLTVENNAEDGVVVLGFYAYLEREVRGKWYCVKEKEASLGMQAGGGVVSWDGAGRTFELNFLPLEPGTYRVVIPDSVWSVAGMLNPMGYTIGVEFMVK